jgi:hypothetical protein
MLGPDVCDIKPDSREFAERFQLWLALLADIPCGSDVLDELSARLRHPPDSDARQALLDAAERDRRMAEDRRAEALIASGEVPPHSSFAFEVIVAEAHHEARRQAHLRRWKRLKCETCDGRKYHPRPHVQTVPVRCLRCGTIARERKPTKWTSYEPRNDHEAIVAKIRH